MPKPLLGWSIVLAIPALVYWAVAMDLRFSGSQVEDDVRMWVAKQSQRLGAFEELAVGVAVAVPVALLLSHFAARRRWTMHRISKEIEAAIRPAPDLLPRESGRVIDFGGQLESHAREAPHPEPSGAGQIPAKVDASPAGEDSIESSREEDSEKSVEEMAIAGDGWLDVEGSELSDAEEPSAGWESVDEEDASHPEAVDEDGWEIVQDEPRRSPRGGSKR